MGKNKNLTPEQKSILIEAKTNPYINSRFYFTGGTALSTFYLHHRYSDDIDFFTTLVLESDVISKLVNTWAQKIGASVESRFVEVVYIFYLTFKNGSKLKIDFSYYPYKLIEKGEMLDQLHVDSLRDIATNKLLTIQQRTDVKDFVDLFFLFKTFTVWDLIYGVQSKFGVKLDILLLSSDFLKVEDFTYLPKMITPLSLTQLKLFFRTLAKDLGKKALE